MIIEQLSSDISSMIDNNISLNRNITANINGNNIMLVQCNANIRINESISYYIRVNEQYRDIFNANKEEIQSQVDAWKLEVEVLATENQVPII